MNKNNYIIEDVPEYLKDEYLTKYVIGKNHRECIMNLFQLHTESVNVWTIVCSYISVLIITIYIFIKNQFSNLNSLIFIINLLAYTIHTPFSIAYHTFSPISQNEFIKWRKYDIYTLFLKCIILSFTLSYFTYSNFKYVLLNISLTTTVVYYSLLKFKESEDKHEPLNKKEHGVLIGLSALTALLPMIYKIFISIIKKNYTSSFKIALLGIIFYIIGFICYIFRIPDRYFKVGYFDNIGSSHNILHMIYIITSICEILYIYFNSKEGNFIKSFK